MNYSNFQRWIETTPMSERLKNALRYYDSIYTVREPSEVREELFRAIRGNGKKSWEEFEEVLKETGK
jgi:DNA-directed RNA polymerase alpha subunit